MDESHYYKRQFYFSHKYSTNAQMLTYYAPHTGNMGMEGTQPLPSRAIDTFGVLGKEAGKTGQPTTTLMGMCRACGAPGGLPRGTGGGWTERWLGEARETG